MWSSGRAERLNRFLQERGKRKIYRAARAGRSMHDHVDYARAVLFAAEAHRGATRDGSDDPYFIHPLRVAELLRHNGAENYAVLITAVLHDVLEETTTKYDDIEKHFGPEVARWVALLSNDRRLPKAERKRDMISRLATAPDEVALVKLADRLDNLSEARKKFTSPAALRNYLDESRKLVEALTKGRTNPIISTLAARVTESVERPG